MNIIMVIKSSGIPCEKKLIYNIEIVFPIINIHSKIVSTCNQYGISKSDFPIGFEILYCLSFSSSILSAASSGREKSISFSL